MFIIKERTFSSIRERKAAGIAKVCPSFSVKIPWQRYHSVDCSSMCVF